MTSTTTPGRGSDGGPLRRAPITNPAPLAPGPTHPGPGAIPDGGPGETSPKLIPDGGPGVTSPAKQ